MKKTVSIFMAMLLMLCMLSNAACAQESTATVKGFAGDVTVIVNVTDGKIESVKVEGINETPGIGSRAIEQLPSKIVDAQSIAIDGVAGATVTSTAVLTAAKEALLAAGLSEEAITVAPQAAEVSTETLEYTADVIVVGSGGSGMSAALEALNHGASVIVLEKMDNFGGATMFAGSLMNASQPVKQATQKMPPENVATIESYLALEPKHELMKVWQAQIADELRNYKENGCDYLFDSNAFHKLQTYVGGDYVANPELISILCDQAIEGVYWLENLGAIWKDEIVDVFGSTWTRGHTPTKDLGVAGANFVLPQYNHFTKNGGEIKVSHKAEELIMENGAVIGVRGTTTAGQPFVAHANRNVVLATGGFSSNEDMCEYYNEQWPTLRGLKSTNPPSSTGDGIVMAEKIGANLVGMGWIQLVPYSTKTVTAIIDGCVYLDKDAKRFVAEDARRDVIAAKTIEQNDGWYWWLIEKKTIDMINGVGQYGQVLTESDDGETLFYAETLEELATESGLSYENLKATLDEYNASVAAGVDPIGRKNMPLTVDEGPYCMWKAEIMTHHTQGGLEINTDCQVMSVDGKPIPGLYAAGEVTGGIHGTNRLGGNAIADLIVFGRIAGTNAATR